MKRCAWCGDDPLYVNYHDSEWGVPVVDDVALFEKLILDGFQAGLSWLIVLKKREHMRRVFDDFNPERIARYAPRKLDELLADPGIIRNRAKVHAAVSNAQAFLAIQERGSFAEELWSFVGGEPVQNQWKTLAKVPTETSESRALAKHLKGNGFKFCGPTIVYAFMQAVGMVNDHLVTCFRHAELG